MRAHRHGIAGPEADHAEKQPAFIERQFRSVEACVRAALAMEYDALLQDARHLQPERCREGLRALKTPCDAREAGGVIPVEAQGLADLSRHQLVRRRGRAGVFCIRQVFELAISSQPVERVVADKTWEIELVIRTGKPYLKRGLTRLLDFMQASLAQAKAGRDRLTKK